VTRRHVEQLTREQLRGILQHPSRHPQQQPFSPRAAASLLRACGERVFATLPRR
jgi:hypothetical protein